MQPVACIKNAGNNTFLILLFAFMLISGGGALTHEHTLVLTLNCYALATQKK